MRAIAIGTFLTIFAAPALASPCGGRIASLQAKLDSSGTSTTATVSKAANARTVKTRQLLETAKAADRRGDAKGCDAALAEATRETGSAQGLASPTK